jgi:hypothetical protein
MLNKNRICLSSEHQVRESDFCVGIIKEFRMTNCPEHFCKDLATIDWIIWIVYFLDGFKTTFLAFLLDPVFCLLSIVFVEVLLPMQFRNMIDPKR